MACAAVSTLRPIVLLAVAISVPLAIDSAASQESLFAERSDELSSNPDGAVEQHHRSQNSVSHLDARFANVQIAEPPSWQTGLAAPPSPQEGTSVSQFRRLRHGKPHGPRSLPGITSTTSTTTTVLIWRTRRLLIGEAPAGLTPGVGGTPAFVKNAFSICALLDDTSPEGRAAEMGYKTFLSYFADHHGYLNLAYDNRSYALIFWGFSASGGFRQAVEEAYYAMVANTCGVWLGSESPQAIAVFKEVFRRLGDLRLLFSFFNIPVRWRSPALITPYGGIKWCPPDSCLSMEPHPDKQWIGTLEAVRTASQQRYGSGALRTIGYVVDSGSNFSVDMCIPVDHFAVNNGLKVVFNGSMNELGNMQSLVDPIDILVSCVWGITNCSILVLELEARKINPKALILPPTCVGDLHWVWPPASSGGHSKPRNRATLGVEIWVVGMNATSNMALKGVSSSIFENLVLSEAGYFPSQVATIAAATADLAIHGIQSALPIDGPMREPHTIIKSIKRQQGLQSFIGSMDFDAKGLRKQPPVTVQWHQAPNTHLPPGSHPSQSAQLAWQMRMQLGKPMVVGPLTSPFGHFWEAPIWFPKPSFEELLCLTTDHPPQTFGFPAGNASNGKCQICSKGMIAVRSSQFLSQFARTLEVQECHACPPGKVDQGQCVDCLPGTFSAPSRSSRCISCQVGKYQPNTSSTACRVCPPGYFEPSSGATQCTKCPPGRISARVENSCIACPAGTTCSPNGHDYTNTDGNYVILKDQFKPDRWAVAKRKFGVQGGVVFECPHDDGKVCKANGICAKGATGVLCGKCAKNYARNEVTDACEECPGGFVVFLLCVGNALWISILSLSLAALANVIADDSIGQIKVAICKQIINYVAIMYVVLQFVTLRIGGRDSSLTLANILGWMRILGYSSPAMLERAASCQLHMWAPDTNVAYSMVVMGHLMVPMWMLVAVFWFFIVKVFTIAFLDIEIKVRTFLPGSMLIQLYLVHIRTTKMFRDVSICRLYDSYRLLTSTDVFCHDLHHLAWELVSFIGIAVWCIGLPIAFFFALRRAVAQNALSRKDTRLKLGFLYMGFRPEFYYWEIIHMLRGVCLQLTTSIYAFSTPEPPVGVSRSFADSALLGLTMGLVAVSVAVEHSCVPYDFRAGNVLNRSETASLWAVLFTLSGQTMKQKWKEMEVLSGETFLLGVAESFLCICILVLHLRFFVHAVSGLLAGTARNQGEEGKRSSVEICKGGLFTAHLTPSDQKQFCQLVKSMVLLQIRTLAAFSPTIFGQGMERVVVETVHRHKLDTEVQRLAVAMYNAQEKEKYAGSTPVQNVQNDAFFNVVLNMTGRGKRIRRSATRRVDQELSADPRRVATGFAQDDEVSSLEGCVISVSAIFDCMLKCGSNIFCGMELGDVFEEIATARGSCVPDPMSSSAALSRFRYSSDETDQRDSQSQEPSGKDSGTVSKKQIAIERTHRHALQKVHEVYRRLSAPCEPSQSAGEAVGIEVYIKAVEGITLPSRNTYCICGLVGEKDGLKARCQTKAGIRLRLEVCKFTWDHYQSFPEFCIGDALEFSIWHEGVIDTSSGTPSAYAQAVPRPSVGSSSGALTLPSADPSEDWDRYASDNMGGSEGAGGPVLVGQCWLTSRDMNQSKTFGFEVGFEGTLDVVNFFEPVPAKLSIRVTGMSHNEFQDSPASPADPHHHHHHQGEPSVPGTAPTAAQELGPPELMPSCPKVQQLQLPEPERPGVPSAPLKNDENAETTFIDVVDRQEPTLPFAPHRFEISMQHKSNAGRVSLKCTVPNRPESPLQGSPRPVAPPGEHAPRMHRSEHTPLMHLPAHKDEMWASTGARPIPDERSLADCHGADERLRFEVRSLETQLKVLKHKGRTLPSLTKVTRSATRRNTSTHRHRHEVQTDEDWHEGIITKEDKDELRQQIRDMQQKVDESRSMVEGLRGEAEWLKNSLLHARASSVKAKAPDQGKADIVRL